MITGIELFSNEPIDNVISSLLYKIDKLIFFGFKDVMTEEKKASLEKIIYKKTKVKEILYYEVDRCDLENIFNKMEEVILGEIEKENKCYLDTTGGEDLILVASGMIIQKYNIIARRVYLEQKTDDKKVVHKAFTTKDSTIENTKKDEKKLSVEEYINLRSSVIIYEEYKDYKKLLEDPTYKEEVNALWEIMSNFSYVWTFFSDLVKLGNYQYDQETTIIPTKSVQKYASNNKNISYKQICKILNELSKNKLLKSLSFTDQKIKFAYKNDFIKNCLHIAGNVLELKVFSMIMQSNQFDDCLVGVPLNWSGFIKKDADEDVRNEVDVICIKNNIPYFISCKNGKVGLDALYELDTVAKKFGGIYAKRILIASKGIRKAMEKRAKEMNIVVIKDEIFRMGINELIAKLG